MQEKRVKKKQRPKQASSKVYEDTIGRRVVERLQRDGMEQMRRKLTMLGLTSMKDFI